MIKTSHDYALGRTLVLRGGMGVLGGKDTLGVSAPDPALYEAKILLKTLHQSLQEPVLRLLENLLQSFLCRSRLPLIRLWGLRDYRRDWGSGGLDFGSRLQGVRLAELSATWSV